MTKPNPNPLLRKRLWPAIAEFPELQPLWRHVAMLLVEDKPRSLIAQKLGITRGTISTITSRLLDKLDVDGIAGLTRLAMRRGYIK